MLSLRADWITAISAPGSISAFDPSSKGMEEQGFVPKNSPIEKVDNKMINGMVSDRKSS